MKRLCRCLLKYFRKTVNSGANQLVINVFLVNALCCCLAVLADIDHDFVGSSDMLVCIVDALIVLVSRQKTADVLHKVDPQCADHAT